MAQFDVYELGDGFVVDLQTDLLGLMPARLVCPLRRPGDQIIPHPRLNPTVTVGGETHVVLTQYASAVSRRLLARPVDNLDRYYDQLKAAYDMVFLGF